LGILVIAGIYGFSRWQEKNRQTQKIRNRAQSANRNTKTGVASAPTFERSEPGFGQTDDEDTNEASFASLDTLEPTMGRDLVDADQAAGDWERTPQDLHSQSHEELQQPSGIATPIQSSYENEQPETEVDDVPVLENMVYEGDATAAIDSAGDFISDSAEAVLEEIDSDGYAAEEPEVLSEMVQPPQSEPTEEIPELKRELDTQDDSQFTEELPEKTALNEFAEETESLEPVPPIDHSGQSDVYSAVDGEQQTLEPIVEQPVELAESSTPQMYQQSSFLDENYVDEESLISPQMEEEVEVEQDPEVEYAQSRPY